MKRNVKTLLSLTLGVVLGAAMVGCESGKAVSAPEPKKTETYQDTYSVRAPTPEERKAIAEKREEPKPQPAPAATGTCNVPAGMSQTQVYLPTGDRSTSAMMIQKFFPAEVVTGQTFDYYVCATNISRIALGDVVVTDTAPTNFKIASTDPKGDVSGQNMVFRLGDMASGSSRLIKVTGAAGSAGQVANCSSATWSNSVCMAINVVQPALKITKSAPAEVLICDTIPVKIEVTNSGSGMARNVKVTDTLAANLATSDGKTGTITFDAGNLGPGQSKPFTFNVKASKTGSYNNAASASAEGGLTANSNQTTTVVKQPVLTIKAECSGAILIGREATFKFTVKNTGDATSANTTVTAPVAAGGTFTGADSGGTVSGGNVVWNLGSLAAGDSKTVSYRARSMKGETLVAKATAQGACAAAVTDQCTTPVQGVPDIGISLSDDDGVVLVGDNHVFRYTVKNQGQVDLTNITVNVEMSAGLDYVGTDASAKPTVDGKKLTFKAVNVLKPGEERSFTLTCKGNAAGEQWITTVTGCDELKRTSRADEQVNYVPR